MLIPGPIHHGKFSAHALLRLGAGILLAALLTGTPAQAQDGRQLESIQVQSLPGQRLELRLQMNSPAPEPMSFTIDDPARIAVDLPGTSLALDSRRQNVNVGPVSTVLAAESNGRTRVVLNLSAMTPYSTRVEGNAVVVEIGGSAGSQPTFAAQANQQGAGPAAAAGPRTINNIDFRRGPDGAGQVLVELSDPGTAVDVREESGRVIVEFEDTSLPGDLMRRLDVADFATPVATIDALREDGNAQLVVTPSSAYEQVAYQADNRFTLELKSPPAEEPVSAGVFSEEKEYVGDPLTLTFQDLETRAVLQVLADFSGLNIVVSDSVQGNVTLRLQDVPWDQALDVVMTTKGLAMRRNGNVIFIAPADEIAAREQADLEARQAREQLAPLQRRLIQVNYAKASDLAELIRGSDAGALLSDRGTVTVDPRTNQLIVVETNEALQEIERLVTTLDIPVRQVSIETRIVIVNDDFGRELGVRLGNTIVRENSSDGLISLTGSSEGSDTIVGSALDNLASGSGSPFPVTIGPAQQRYNVNLPVTSPAGVLSLAILDNDFLVDLELSAVQTEGKGEIYSTPRIITANNKEAYIKQGVEIPYQEASSSGATTTQFKEAVLSLTVTPQITPDDRIILDLLITKDNVGELVQSARGGFVPSIDTRSLQNQVLVSDGQTIVLGGIYETETRDTVSKVPVLGDIPGLGFLFRTRTKSQNKAELLIFVTPRIVPDSGLVDE
jgi:type IV pilus assembly protein PilQ